MKNIYSILFCVLFSISLQAQPKAIEIKVDIINVPTDKGQVIVKLYKSEENYLKIPEAVKMAAIIEGKATVLFEDIGKGEYAIAVIHDENGNGKFDFTFFGMPKEDAAASNNAKGFFGPPKYADAHFEVNNETVVQVIELLEVHKKG